MDKLRQSMHRTSSKEITDAKLAFKKFFKRDVYGRFFNDKNIILSRGGWQDSFITFPKFFQFSLRYTFQKHWTGYSDSLGHHRTLQALARLVNVRTADKKYRTENMALTIGNVMTIGLVFRQLKQILPNSEVVTLTPYYPPILKSVNYYFKKILLISSLLSENDLLCEIDISLKMGNKILFLSNSIGVEGRVFSKIFWKTVVQLIHKYRSYLVIDEGFWFQPLHYGPNINHNRVIRVVSLSKKYGIPGCKLGFMLAGKGFIKDYYDYASTNYGGPLSAFFLLSEFLYQFEYIRISAINRNTGLRTLKVAYGVPQKRLRKLYEDYLITHQKNEAKLRRNRQVFLNWAKENHKYIKRIYDFGGINVFIKLNSDSRAYLIFLRGIKSGMVSIMPSICLGDSTDSLLRITLLEPTQKLVAGLWKFTLLLSRISR